jgi:hypothetical protein
LAALVFGAGSPEGPVLVPEELEAAVELVLAVVPDEPELVPDPLCVDDPPVVVPLDADDCWDDPPLLLEPPMPAAGEPHAPSNAAPKAIEQCRRVIIVTSHFPRQDAETVPVNGTWSTWQRTSTPLESMRSACWLGRGSFVSLSEADRY